MAEDELRFTEAPRSPFRRSRIRRASSPLDRPMSAKCEDVGCLSAVNTQMSSVGFTHKRQLLKPLVSELYSSRVAKSREISPHIPANKRSKANDPPDTALVEMATYPGFYHSQPTPLPHHINPSEHLRRVLTAQQDPCDIKFFGKLFLSEPSIIIIQDIFWWFFLHWYKHSSDNSTSLDLMFNRVAANYVRLLCSEHQYHKREYFFKVYPSLVAQAVYSAFMHAFPTSWNSFDELFKSELCNIVFLWFTGAKLQPELWRRWNITALEPTNLLKHVSDSQGDKASSSKVFDLKELLSTEDSEVVRDGVDTEDVCGASIPTVAMVTSEPHMEEKASSISMGSEVPHLQTRARRRFQSQNELLMGPQFQNVVFDSYGHSPLVQHHLQRHNLIYKCGYACLLPRTEISRLPSPSGTTYQDILTASSRHRRQTLQQFNRYYTRLVEHSQRGSRTRRTLSMQHDRDITSLMRHPKQLSALSKRLTIHLLNDQLSDRKMRDLITQDITAILHKLSI